MLNETKSEGFPVKEIWVSVGPTEGASKKREEGSVSFGPVTAHYEAKDEKTGTTLIAMQPLVADQAYIPQMKAMCVPFHMVYGRLMCY